MTAVIKYEFNLLKKKRVILAFAACLLLAVLTTAKGVFFYETGRERNDYFTRLENDRLDKYTNYLQYGNDGVVILNELPGINTLFSPKKFIMSEMCNIRNDAFLKIYADIRGKEKIIYGNFISFANFILLLVIVMPLIAGFTHFRSFHNIKFYKGLKNVLVAVATRLFFLIFFIMSCFIAALLYLKSSGILLSGRECYHFAYFFLQAAAICAFFYFIALLIATGRYIKNKKMVAAGFALGIIALTAPFVINAISSNMGISIPHSSEVDYNKSKYVFDFERKGKERLKDTKPADRFAAMRQLARDFLKDDYAKIRRLEKERIGNETNIFGKIDKISAFSPVSFFLTAADAAAGLSDDQYIGYIKYCDQKQYELLEFFIDKMYSLIRPEQSGKIIPFFKNGDNIFESQPQLPRYYLLNLTMNGLYLLLLTVLIFFNLKTYFRQKQREPEEAGAILDEIDDEDINFIKARNIVERDELFEFLEANKKDAVFLDRVCRDDFFDIKIKHLYSLYCSLNPVDEERFLKYSAIFKIDEGILEKRISGLDNAGFKRFYAAMVLANDRFLVVNDFLEGEDLELRIHFSRLIENLSLEEKRGGIYIGFRFYKSIFIEDFEEDEGEEKDKLPDQKYLTININKTTNNFEMKLIF